jgi:alkaline phosphatase D
MRAAFAPAFLLLAACATRADSFRIVFGSCSKHVEHPMLDRVLEEPMDLFLYLGDNVYADTVDMAVMRRKYDALKQSRFHRTLRERVPVLATWDDHDFGANDAGAEYPMKRESQQEFLDWLDVPAGDPRRRQEGVHHAETFGPPGRRVQVLLLDTRTFRSPMRRAEKGKETPAGPHLPTEDPAATVLGEAQWAWLEARLREPAELRVVVSSIQFAAEACGAEGWGNFPLERRRFLDLLARSGARGVLVLSGDRHWSELSRIDGPAGYPVWDLTCSALTQPHPRGTPSPNAARAHPATFHAPNAGSLTVDWGRPDPRITLRVFDAGGATRIRQELSLSDLAPR